MGKFSVPVTPPVVVEFTVGVSSRPSAPAREGGLDAPSAAGCGAAECDREQERVLRAGRGARFSDPVTPPAAEEAIEFAAGVAKRRGTGLGVASLASSV